jgi:hypothetical protein
MLAKESSAPAAPNAAPKQVSLTVDSASLHADVAQPLNFPSAIHFFNRLSSILYYFARR